MAKFEYECPDCGANENSRAVDCCDTCVEIIFTGGLEIN